MTDGCICILRGRLLGHRQTKNLVNTMKGRNIDDQTGTKDIRKKKKNRKEAKENRKNRKKEFNE
jgi:hypothetical protein